VKNAVRLHKINDVWNMESGYVSILFGGTFS